MAKIIPQRAVAPDGIIHFIVAQVANVGIFRGKVGLDIHCAQTW